jgi:hypothetical protein
VAKRASGNKCFYLLSNSQLSTPEAQLQEPPLQVVKVASFLKKLLMARPATANPTKTILITSIINMVLITILLFPFLMINSYLVTIQQR